MWDSNNPINTLHLCIYEPSTDHKTFMGIINKYLSFNNRKLLLHFNYNFRFSMVYIIYI
jgi:hypothetical protein